MTSFGVHAGPQMCTMDELRGVWRTAEELGFDWISVWDHFYPAPSPPDGDCFEAVACHAALAATTSRPRLGCLVYSAGYRHPAVLANAGVRSTTSPAGASRWASERDGTTSSTRRTACPSSLRRSGSGG